MSNSELSDLLNKTTRDLHSAMEEYSPGIETYEAGTVIAVHEGVAVVEGIPNVGSEELIRFPGGSMGIAFNLDPDTVSVVLLDRNSSIQAGDQVRRTQRIMEVPVGRGLLGRVIDPIGRPLDGGGEISSDEHRAIERSATPIMRRQPVEEPLQTGIQAIDALIPVGKGQRELILGDRQTGKTAIVLDTIINQRDNDVVCIYCAVGQRNSAVAEVVEDLKRYGVMEKSVVVSATGDDPPGMNFAAPYTATAIGEYFMDGGGDALVIYDDLTRHARSYRELSLLLRRPPAREAYPGDIFYIHSRLLERATHLLEEDGGGSLTALPIIETQNENVSSYIPTNLISITDGQILLSSKLYQQGQLPAIDIGRSVSRVGGKTQLPAYRSVAGDLRLSYSQFEELEGFARFGVNLDEATRRTLERGRRVRETLKQPQYDPMEVPFQMAMLVGVNKGAFDRLSPEEIGQIRGTVRTTVKEELGEISEKIMKGEKLGQNEIEKIADLVRGLVQDYKKEKSEETAEGEEDAR